MRLQRWVVWQQIIVYSQVVKTLQFTTVNVTKYLLITKRKKNARSTTAYLILRILDEWSAWMRFLQSFLSGTRKRWSIVLLVDARAGRKRYTDNSQFPIFSCFKSDINTVIHFGQPILTEPRAIRRVRTSRLPSTKRVPHLHHSTLFEKTVYDTRHIV